ncbi:peptidase M16 [candidate division WOR-1 bacterium RIFOXYD2_FULL_36_8]|uniref:Peptidase M16 n=1 Tax=candidate division WOR-1 bacterium RIFOXYB2_FULL_36_35 TaxID=1802578 RepID=A0A1F4RXY2_UNCSA|nr:MAG: peptidase M16 [candidate division WOR-1 bacterium RIFOXYA2_FULL_36_21]OGC13030.1 MAG: peptidase M16 [candidate division WOR-1 bacterium RIFOXYB2_FULL_36_35]OGC20998.1 MAG: peptidase M16 [candidate division WOR-1 bacterium RIFOXYA12_FULL_36_13]OGC38972.1 MAG: peptidase M16 [candidate division WOR-1 bacterium RIFOXYD2_FULL_36_8]
MRIFLIVLILSFIFSASSNAKDINFLEYDLPNGLHVILHQNRSVPIVVVSVMYHVGSKNEDPHKTGFAHFFEHLMFEGSDNIGRGEYAKYVNSAGGICNANTTVDRTYYYEEFPSNQLALGLWLESERMLHAKVDEVGIKTQKEVVKEERRLRYDNQPYGTVMEEIMKRSYINHPYRWTTIGSMNDIGKATFADFAGFYKTFYVPNNAVLVVAGDIEIGKTKKLVSRYFSDIPKSFKNIPRPVNIETAQTSETKGVVYDNIRLPAIVFAYHIPAWGEKDFYAIELLTSVLSGGASSRLYKSLVDDTQKALDVSMFALPYEHSSLALVFATANLNVALFKLLDLIDKELDKVKHEVISDYEMQKLKNQIENTSVDAKSSLAGIAENLAGYYTFFHNTNLINTEIDKYLDVTKEDIKRVANKYFTKKNRVVLYWEPVQYK